MQIDNNDNISMRKNDIDKSLIHPNQHTMINLFLLLRNTNIFGAFTMSYISYYNLRGNIVKQNDKGDLIVNL